MRARLMIAAAGAVGLGACARPVVYQGYSTATRAQAVALIGPSDGNDIGEIDGRSIPPDTELGTAVVEVLPGEHAVHGAHAAHAEQARQLLLDLGTRGGGGKPLLPAAGPLPQRLEGLPRDARPGRLPVHLVRAPEGSLRSEI